MSAEAVASALDAGELVSLDEALAFDRVCLVVVATALPLDTLSGVDVGELLSRGEAVAFDRVCLVVMATALPLVARVRDFVVGYSSSDCGVEEGAFLRFGAMFDEVAV